MPRMMPSPANGSGSGGADDANTPPEAGGYDPSRSAVVPTMMNRLMSGGNVSCHGWRIPKAFSQTSTSAFTSASFVISDFTEPSV